MDVFNQLREAVATSRVSAESGRIALREMQIGVVDDAMDYITARAEEGVEEPAFARIILPPRSGKTVVAAKLVERLRLNATFITTTRVLAEQARREFIDKLPGVPIGLFTGEEKISTESGITITTYQMLYALHARGEHPEAIRRSALVFADEAHHVMTRQSSAILREHFDPSAIRIALTATPDYDELRALARYFPDLIHEVTISEGVELGLLADVHAYVADVDLGASDVRVFGGEYDASSIGELLARVPILKAAEIIRYDDAFREIPALVTCASRAQAEAIYDWLTEHRPTGAPKPALILQNTTRDQREQMLTAFDDGALDTIVCVGVLVEGWNAPRCKLLVDLSPSLSWVRAAQKFSRVMTKHDDAEAHIIILAPSDLKRPPILPNDVFGPSVETSWDHLAEKECEPRKPQQHKRHNPFQRMRDAGIRVQMSNVNVRLSNARELAELSRTPRGRERIRAIVKTNASVWPPSAHFLKYSTFLSAHFLMNGIPVRGSYLLNAFGYKPGVSEFRRFIYTCFPDEVVDALVCTSHNRRYYQKKWNANPVAFEKGMVFAINELEESCADQFRRAFYCEDGTEPLIHRPITKYERGLLHHVEMGAIAASGGEERPPLADILDEHREITAIKNRVTTIYDRDAKILARHFGLLGEDESRTEIASTDRMTVTNVSRILQSQIEALKRWCEKRQL